MNMHKIEIVTVVKYAITCLYVYAYKLTKNIEYVNMVN